MRNKLGLLWQYLVERRYGYCCNEWGAQCSCLQTAEPSGDQNKVDNESHDYRCNYMTNESMNVLWAGIYWSIAVSTMSSIEAYLA
mgnify:CR=1 FL=1